MNKNINELRTTIENRLSFISEKIKEIDWSTEASQYYYYLGQQQIYLDMLSETKDWK